MFKRARQWIECRRDDLMVLIAKHCLGKVDRMFHGHLWMQVSMLGFAGVIFCLSFWAASTSLFAFPEWVWMITSALSPLPILAWSLLVSNWLQGSAEVADQRDTLNQITSNYGLVQRHHYNQAEAWLINNYLAPAKRIEQAARQLECSTQGAPSSGQARRL